MDKNKKVRKITLAHKLDFRQVLSHDQIIKLVDKTEGGTEKNLASCKL